MSGRHFESTPRQVQSTPGQRGLMTHTFFCVFRVGHRPAPVRVSRLVDSFQSHLKSAPNDQGEGRQTARYPQPRPQRNPLAPLFFSASFFVVALKEEVSSCTACLNNNRQQEQRSASQQNAPIIRDLCARVSRRRSDNKELNSGSGVDRALLKALIGSSSHASSPESK